MLKKTKISAAIATGLVGLAGIGASAGIITNSYQTNKKVSLITKNSNSLQTENRISHFKKGNLDEKINKSENFSEFLSTNFFKESKNSAFSNLKKIIKSDKKEIASVFSKFYNKNSKKILSKKEAIKIYNNLSNNDKNLLQSIQSSVLQNFYFNYSLAVVKWHTVCLNVYVTALECQNILNLAANFNDQTSALQQGLDGSGPFGELAGSIIGLIGSSSQFNRYFMIFLRNNDWSYISFFIWIYSNWRINWVQHMSVINLFWYE